MIDSVGTSFVACDIGYPGMAFEVEVAPVEWATFSRLHEALSAARTAAFWRAVKVARDAVTPEQWATLEAASRAMCVDAMGDAAADPSTLQVALGAAALAGVVIDLAHDLDYWAAACALTEAGCTGRFRTADGTEEHDPREFAQMRTGPKFARAFFSQRVPLSSVLAIVVVEHNTLTASQKKT